MYLVSMIGVINIQKDISEVFVCTARTGPKGLCALHSGNLAAPVDRVGASSTYPHG